jgi:long-subunit fatty acid transport protein
MYRKPLFIIFLLFLFAFSIQGQTFRHPYSYYGIGELQEQTLIVNSSLGGLSYGWNDRFSVTPLNPASYSNLDFVTFDLGIKCKIQNLLQGDINQLTNNVSFSYFSMAFPVYKKIGWGASIGLIPVSKIGYKNTYEFLTDSAYTKEEFDNYGGLSQFYIGNSFTLYKKLNIGFNLSYFFGNTQLNHNLEFTNNYYNLGVTKRIQKSYGKIGLNFGAQYKGKINKDVNFTVGGAYSLPMDLKVKQELITITFKNINSANSYKDTLQNITEENQNMTIPMNFGLGFIFAKKLKWKLGADFKYEAWSSYKATDNNFKLRDQWTVNVGGEYIPKWDDNKYSKRIAYRFGIKYVNTFLQVNDYNYNKISAVIGAGFPFAKNLSNINLGVEVGTMGKKQDNLIKENFFNIFLGFRLNDLWFIKPKIE